MGGNNSRNCFRIMGGGQYHIPASNSRTSLTIRSTASRSMARLIYCIDAAQSFNSSHHTQALLISPFQRYHNAPSHTSRLSHAPLRDWPT